MLAEPSLRTEPGDALKYVSLSRSDPKRYLSFGITLRERFESNDALLFGAGGTRKDSYLLHRLELHADAHLTDRTRVFVQLENALAPGRAHPTPADANKADLRLALLDTGDKLGDGIYTVRIGRQEVAFDLQRFASVRDGANVRQAFDGLWVRYERGDWLSRLCIPCPCSIVTDPGSTTSALATSPSAAYARIGSSGPIRA